MALITTKFNITSTAEEVVAGHDLSGLRAIVTGASSGIGIETARSLAGAGAHVTLAVRNTVAGESVAHDITGATGNKNIEVAHLEMAERATIIRFVEAWKDPLHLLINNAGIMIGPLRRTAEGWELQFGTNHLGHFALALGLHGALAAGAKERGGARIVVVASSAHGFSGIDFDDLQFDRRPYDEFIAYGQSKTANILFAVEAWRRWGKDGIATNALCPGNIDTGLQKFATPEMKQSWKDLEKQGVIKMKNLQQGAATTMVAAVAPEFAKTGGHYLFNCNEAKTMTNDADFFSNMDCVREWALDPVAAKRLWDVSLDLVQSPAAAAA